MNTSELEQYIPSTEFPLNQERKLDEGADSAVYRYGDHVIKVYKERTPKIDLDGLLLYWDITNQLADRFKKDNTTYKVSINGEVYEYCLDVNPILLAGSNPHNPSQLISVSKYIDGFRLTEKFPDHVPFGTREFDDPVSLQLENLSDDLNKQFGVKGILILSPNVKFNYQQGNNPPILLTITDISSHLWAFGPAKPPTPPG